MTVYAYAVVAGARAPELGSIAGCPDTEALRAVRAAPRLHVIVADAREDAWSEDAIARGLRDIDWVSERALRHDEVLGALLDAEAVIPMKAFTLFRTEARAIEHVKTQAESLREIASRVKGCVEWGVRLRFDEQLAKESAARAAQQAASSASSAGAAFLLRKKAQLDASRSVRSEALAAAQRAGDALLALAREGKRVPPAESGALLEELALLIPKSQESALQREASRVDGDLRANGVIVELTGPWAPFHFVEARS